MYPFGHAKAGTQPDEIDKHFDAYETYVRNLARLLGVPASKQKELDDFIEYMRPYNGMTQEINAYTREEEFRRLRDYQYKGMSFRDNPNTPIQDFDLIHYTNDYRYTFPYRPDLDEPLPQRIKQHETVDDFYGNIRNAIDKIRNECRR